LIDVQGEGLLCLDEAPLYCGIERGLQEFLLDVAFDAAERATAEHDNRSLGRRVPDLEAVPLRFARL